MFGPHCHGFSDFLLQINIVGVLRQIGGAGFRSSLPSPVFRDFGHGGFDWLRRVLKSWRSVCVLIWQRYDLHGTESRTTRRHNFFSVVRTEANLYALKIATEVKCGL